MARPKLQGERSPVALRSCRQVATGGREGRRCSRGLGEAGGAPGGSLPASLPGGLRARVGGRSLSPVRAPPATAAPGSQRKEAAPEPPRGWVGCSPAPPSPGWGLLPIAHPLQGLLQAKGCLGPASCPQASSLLCWGSHAPPLVPQKAAPGFVILLSPDPGTGWGGKRGCIPAAAMLGHSPGAERGAGCSHTPIGWCWMQPRCPSRLLCPCPSACPCPRLVGLCSTEQGQGPEQLEVSRMGSTARGTCKASHPTLPCSSLGPHLASPPRQS